MHKPFDGEIARHWWRWSRRGPMRWLPPVPFAAGAGVGSPARARAINEFVRLVSDLDLRRPAPTFRSLQRTLSEIFKAASLATPYGECPLFLSLRVRREYTSRTRSHHYIFEHGFIPPLRYLSRRLLAARCPAYRPVDTREDALRGGVHPELIREDGNRLDVLPQAADWCARNKAPCEKCRARSREAALADPDGLASWRGALPDQSRAQTTFQR